ncbi:hypothetical protein THAOC_09319 [Thalassiosira oceanica]|uniref:Uncharacterized protein n=1 Tax=Thalassiosira oceanica TaxID=159749 RepID=K0SWT8_THAOC|nr:hypothetical protein THAOC_09319 [Thalassiosira oceanica]|eukprot:EJK69429.1 hypothetical protein THAOC_09319 [Thalassiosira oceanica]
MPTAVSAWPAWPLGAASSVESRSNGFTIHPVDQETELQHCGASNHCGGQDTSRTMKGKWAILSNLPRKCRLWQLQLFGGECGEDE